MSENLFNPTEIQEMSVSYQSFLSEAKALVSSSVVSLRTDPIIAYENVKTASKNILTEANVKLLKEKDVSEERIKKMQQVREIAQAVVYAHLEAERSALREPTGIGALITRASQLRKAHLLLAESLVSFGLLKENEVEQIVTGSGSGIDLANDCTMLTALFSRNEESLKGKTPTTPALLTEMSKLGSELLAVLRPSNAAPASESNEAWRAAQDIRDRLWTLLDQRYDFMVAAAVELVGRRKVNRLVPPLQSRAVPAKKREA